MVVSQTTQALEVEAARYPQINKIDARFKEVISPRASLGFIALATDRAGHKDFYDFLKPVEGLEIFSTRIPFVETATPETLAAMGEHLQQSTRLLVPGQPLDSISFSCTSGTVAIGLDRVKQEIQQARPDTPVATPIEAAGLALQQLECKRISLLMPYLLSTATLITDYFDSLSISMDEIATFDLAGDPEINRVDPECIIEQGLRLCHEESDALFISCTGWLTFDVIEALEEKLQRPVITSNQALAWQALRSAGIDDKLENRGQLFRQL